MITMLNRILFLLAIGGSVVTINTAEAAWQTRYPYCMRGATAPGLSGCTFTSMAQCRATAAGLRASCSANPFYKRRRSSVPLPTGHSPDA